MFTEMYLLLPVCPFTLLRITKGLPLCDFCEKLVLPPLKGVLAL